MELYKTQGGSRFYGIDVPGSDNDILICDSSVKGKQSIYDEKSKIHIYRIPISETIAQLNGFVSVPQWIAFLSPFNNEAPSATDFYLMENNEKIISANRKFLFGTLQRYCGDLPGEMSFFHFPKKSAYKLMLLEGFGRYVDSDKFFESIIPMDPEFFQNIRQGQADYQTFKERWQNTQQKLSSNYSFFSHSDPSFLRENTKCLEEILGCSHEEFVQESFPLVNTIPELSILY